jgi:osmotically inducible protein OsmC
MSRQECEVAMKRTGSAHWEGTLKSGSGRLTTRSGVVSNVAYSFATRFGEQRGTNPEEMIAAAHAGCFSMALAYMLEAEGFTPEQIATTAEMTIRMGPPPEVSGVHLEVRARVPRATDETFRAIAAKAKAECLVSRLLNTATTMTATLESPPADAVSSSVTDF